MASRASKAPKHFLEAHRLICGRDKLRRKSHGKAEYNHVADLRATYNDPNIVGLGIAEKVTNNKRTGELTLCFYVKEKQSKRLLGSHKMIPPVISVGGKNPIFTDVHSIGVLRTQAHFQDDPIESGFSVGNDLSTHAGTVAAIVKSGGLFYILSNAHVLAPPDLNVAGLTIHATFPAFEDTNGMRRVGELRDAVSIKSSGGNRADAALAEIDKSFVDNSEVDTDIALATRPYTIGDPQKGMDIVGIGRTSGLMEGKVRDINFTGSVDVPGVGSVEFVDQAICDKYSEGGDSGALIIAKKSKEIVGLHVGGGDKGSMFTPIRNVRDSLKIKFQFV